MKTGLPPILDARTETLILGSFPSEMGLATGEYYRHPRNAFWRLLAEILAEPLVAMAYSERVARLLARRIGLWNVIAACERQGSTDDRIRNPRYVDFARLSEWAPSLACVAFNGLLPAKRAPVIEALGFETVALPSSSPANTVCFEAKLATWRKGLRPGAGVELAKRRRPENRERSIIR